MPFEIQPLREFLVTPSLPPALSRLDELAHNLLWSWDYTIRTLFRRLDPNLWKQCDHNPVLMLSRIPQQSLEKAASDPRFLAAYRRACDSYDLYLRHDRPVTTSKDPMLVAYFSMEYGLLESLNIYSGGLGILSGDHLKAASDAGLPLVGVGLLYQTGYFQQHVNPDGWQVEKYPVNDFYSWPIQPALDEKGRELRVQVQLPRGLVQIKVWKLAVGRVTLILLDTNIPENSDPEIRDITDQLYGGDSHMRIRQELVLGVGGLRALKATGMQPTVFHMNEGHSAFLAFERIRLMMADHALNFEEALDATRSNNVFTTHTPVPAGIDHFDTGMVHEYLNAYCAETGIPFERLLALGRRNPHEQFSMAVLAMSTSSYRNAVSRLHSEVSQEMFQDLWPNLPQQEVPITPITNGVHLPSWLNGDLAQLYDQYLQPDWRETYIDPSVWAHISDIPNRELWEARRRRKRQLISFIRDRVTQRAVARNASASELRRITELFNPDVLTIGFARRFATYKRATLVFEEIDRLRRVLSNPDMPAQLIIAGKAHPKDNPGKQLIREIVQLTRDPVLSRHVVFLEDYDIQVGRELVQGVDLWLNNPRRGEEACGTSGMKAALNGTLNCSILDGWYDEAYETSGGWAIGDRSPYTPDQDELHASEIYSLLENEILPMYYKNRDEGVPTQWMQRVKQCLMNMSPAFNCQRMIHDYTTRLYEPAHSNFAKLRADSFEMSKEKWSWMQQVESAWPRVHIKEAASDLGACHITGSPVRLRAAVDLAGLEPGDVRVEAVVGHVSSTGALEELTILTLAPEGTRGGVHLFERQFVPHQTGRLGFTFRVSPNHSDDPLARPCGAPMKWAV